jgi:branched-chain amino acid transport system substrate-binding protein
VGVHRVIAVIGPLNPGSAQVVAARAEELEVPVLTLSPDPSLNENADTAYRMLPEPGEEAALLVRAAAPTGARSFVLLHPESGYGQVMRRAFEQAVQRVSGTLTAIAYPPNATSFVREAEQAAHLAPDAVILADGAARIALLAPALAAQGLWSMPPRQKPPEGRAVTYLVPAAGFDPSLAQSARRYLQGAFFAVPFDAASAPEFAAAYRERFRSEPNLFAAAAHDAFRIVETALAGGVTSREALVDALGKVTASDTATAVDGFAGTRGPRNPLRLEMLTGETFVPSD